MNNLLDAVIAAKLAGGGGGGGGGGNDTEFITLVPTSLNVFGGGTWTSNKAFSALASAFDSGASIHVIISNLAFDAAQLIVYQRKGNTLYAHVRFYDGDQINGEFRIFQDGTYSYLNSIPTQDDIGVAPLKLTATPTSGPSGNLLMSGTWSGATWEEVAAAIQNSMFIQVDVATIGKITLLYNLGSATSASSNAFVYDVGGTLYNVFAELLIAGSNNEFKLGIINARTDTVNVSSTTPNIIPVASTIYNCGEVSNLTISNPPATGSYSIVFTSGATPTVTSIPSSILGLESFAAAANTIYEINVLDNRAVIGSWAVSA